MDSLKVYALYQTHLPIPLFGEFIYFIVCLCLQKLHGAPQIPLVLSKTLAQILEDWVNDLMNHLNSWLL